MNAETGPSGPVHPGCCCRDADEAGRDEGTGTMDTTAATMTYGEARVAVHAQYGESSPWGVRFTETHADQVLRRAQRLGWRIFDRSKYAGSCQACGEAMPAGGRIAYVRGAGQAHVECVVAGAVNAPEAPVSSSPRGRGRGRGSRGTVTRFSSGHVVTRNAAGRCIDAPCCGCCSG